jgi:hypothetical protein
MATYKIEVAPNTYLKKEDGATVHTIEMTDEQLLALTETNTLAEAKAKWQLVTA